MELFHRGNFAEEKTRWRLINSLESRTQARSPGVESQSRIERVRNNGRSCYARRSCGRCPDYKRIAFFSSLSLSLFPLPFPLPSCPVHGKARGSGEGPGDAEGWCFSARNKQSGNGSFDRKFHLAPSRGWPSSLTTLPFHSPFHWREGRREGGKWWLVFFPNDYAKWKQPFLHCLLVPFPIENDRSRRDFFYFSGNLLSSADESRILQWNGGNEFICNSCGIIIIIIIIASIWLEILIGIDSFLFSNG